jgi:hypothetical protein
MALKVTKKSKKPSPRFFSKAALVVTILPLWALWVYSYATLRSLQDEVEALPRYYGMYLHKEYVRARLEEAVRLMSLLEGQEVDRAEGGKAEVLTEAEQRKYGLFLGLEQGFVVVERRGLRILHPSEPPYGTADFLGEPEARAAFLRTLRRMDDKGSRGGYFSIDTSESSARSDKRSWFLAMAPVGEDLLCILPVPEEQVRQSGGILEDAQEELLRERRKRFVCLTLPVVVLSCLCIGILCRQIRPSRHGRDT